MKRLISVALAFAMALSLAACGQGAPASTTSGASTPASASQGEKTLSGTLEVWSSGEELGRFVEGFNELYPDVTVNITVVPNADFLAKLTPTLASGQGAPDIFTGESDYVK